MKQPLDRRALTCLALLAGIATLAGSPGRPVARTRAPGPPGPKSAAWTATDCGEFELKDVPAGRGIECGYVTVPLRHAEPDGATIQLAVVGLSIGRCARRGDDAGPCLGAETSVTGGSA